MKEISRAFCKVCGVRKSRGAEVRRELQRQGPQRKHQVSRTPPTVICTQQNGTPQAIEPPLKILAKLLK